MAEGRYVVRILGTGTGGSSARRTVLWRDGTEGGGGDELATPRTALTGRRELRQGETGAGGGRGGRPY